MPTLSRYFVRSSLTCLVVGFILGGLILAAKAGAVSSAVWVWLPAHITILLVGWMVQLGLGVAYWILPRFSGGDRGRPAWAWGAFGACQAGLALVGVSLGALWMPTLRDALTPGILLMALGISLFAVHAWPRIRAA